MDVVAELALSDGPRPLVVPLERGNLGTHYGGVPITIVVHAPMVDAGQEICSTKEGVCSSSLGTIGFRA